MDERGLKVYEYNADSASCHTEAGLILERWAEQGYKGNGFNPAEGLINELAGARKHSRARPFVHIMQDKDIEENYLRSLWSRRCTRRALKRVSCAGWMNWAGMQPGN